MATEKGNFNYQQIMNDFYNWKPKEDDTEGQIAKNAFGGNMIQAGLDAELAMMLGDQNNAIAQEQMQKQADLELANTGALMEKEFGYKELGKESNFKYSEQAADAQYERDVGMLGATGEQQRKNIAAEGQQGRLERIVEGEQARQTAAVNNASNEKIAAGRYAADNYQADKAASASMYGADAQRMPHLGLQIHKLKIS